MIIYSRTALAQDVDGKTNRILGLVHENTYIDQPEYDDYGNLVSARLRTYSKSTSVGTNHDVLDTYRIRAKAEAQGKLVYWEQIEE